MDLHGTMCPLNERIWMPLGRLVRPFVLFAASRPSAPSVKQGRLLADPGGVLLRSAMRLAGLSFVTNSAFCVITHCRDCKVPKDSEAPRRACREFFPQVLHALTPAHVVILGSRAKDAIVRMTGAEQSPAWPEALGVPPMTFHVTVSPWDIAQYDTGAKRKRLMETMMHLCVIGAELGQQLEDVRPEYIENFVSGKMPHYDEIRKEWINV